MMSSKNLDLVSMENQKLESEQLEFDRHTEAMSKDPQLFRKKIDMVNRMGLAGERRNIGCVALVYDSSLIISRDKPRTLSGVIAGSQGTGKSATIKKVGQLYPDSRICSLAKISPASLFRLRDELCHKTLVIEEATQLTKEGDAPATIRTLLSEGKAPYHKCGPENSTVTLTLEGPISFLTTTIAPKLEEQLGDRLIKIFPDESSEQTVEILRNQALAAAGRVIEENSDEVLNWKTIHDNLQPMEVVVPFACEITDRICLNQTLPIGARRGISRVLSGIMAMAVTYQLQRETNDHGQLLADYADYAMARQLIEKSFMDDIGMGEDFADERLMLVKDLGKVTISQLAEIEAVSPPAISEWAKTRLKRGVLTWCDSEGKTFESQTKLARAKSSGAAYLHVPFKMGLPTPYDLTGDPRWQKGGELYELYDLNLENDRTERPSSSRISGPATVFNQQTSSISIGRLRTEPNPTWLNKCPLPALKSPTGLTQATIYPI